jgi:uncharacterized protein (DUF427 family)
MRDAWLGGLAVLRHEPTEKRVRALLGDRAVIDSTRAVLVWEPRRVVPSYAVPAGDIDAELVPAAGRPETGEHPLLHPGIPFAVHSAGGEPLTLRAGGQVREEAAFRLGDPDLSGYVLLDFRAFDRWYEEDEELIAHPRDPYHRVDVRHGSRAVRVQRDGRLLAESTRPTLVFETHLPTRFYLPRADIRAELLPSDRITYCPYKGRASYWSVPGRADIAWTYQQPLPDAVQLAGLVAFFDELVDVTVDGVPRPRPDTAVSTAVLDETGI